MRAGGVPDLAAHLIEGGGGEQFSCLAEARVLIADGRKDHNHSRPHCALGMKAPAVFAREWAAGSQT